MRDFFSYQPQYEQLSFLPDDEKPNQMTVGGVKVTLIDIQQSLARGYDDVYGTSIRVRSTIPIPVDDVCQVVYGSDIATLNGVNFFISSMRYTPFVQYEYVLTSLYLLPRIIGGTNG